MRLSAYRSFVHFAGLVVRLPARCTVNDRLADSAPGALIGQCPRGIDVVGHSDDGSVNSKQMQFCLVGADLLVGHMRGGERSLGTAVENHDVEAIERALDPLVHIASILVRRAGIESGTNGEIVLDEILVRCDPDFAEQYSDLKTIVSTVMAGGVPDEIICNHVLLAAAAQEVGVAAVTMISEATGDHPLKVVGQLRTLIKNQDPSVQFADKAGSSATLAVYASDPAMSACREETAHTIWRLTDTVGNALYDVSVSLHEAGDVDAAYSYNGASRVTKAATSLAAGVIGLTNIANHYPAWALARQVVECEYLLWKFATDTSSIVAWLRSDREEREANWKPARLYSDDTNDYRRKDYAHHCEQGGHPTPVGTLKAGHVLDPEMNSVFVANGYSHLLLHLHRVYEYSVTCADALDSTHGRSTTVPADVRGEYETVIKHYLKTDKFGPATSNFSDPTP